MKGQKSLSPCQKFNFSKLFHFRYVSKPPVMLLHSDKSMSAVIIAIVVPFAKNAVAEVLALERCGNVLQALCKLDSGPLLLTKDNGGSHTHFAVDPKAFKG